MIIGTKLSTINIGLMICGRARWQEAEAIIKIFQYCTDSSGQEFLYLRALQGHSGRNPTDPSLQDNVSTPDNFLEYTKSYRMCNQFTLHHKFRTDTGRTKFFTAVNPMDKEHKDPYKLDLTQPRLAWYKQKTWRRHQDTVYWVDRQLAQRKGLKFYQTRSNAIILYETLPAYCIPTVVVMESGEIIYEKVYVSPRPPPKISFKDNWMQELDSEVAESSKDSQRIKPKPKTQLSRTVRPWVENRSLSSEEMDIDFRVPGFSHAVVKEAENLRVQELVKKIESHPHREAFQDDLQQNNVYNPFSDDAKAMIRELSNIELFELCQTKPKVQCSQCLLYWNQGVICCTCGRLLVESESRR